MSPRIKILRAAYQRIGQDALALYAANVIQNTSNSAAYAPVQPAIQHMQTALNQFKQARANAADGGKAVTVLKNMAKDQLRQAMDAFCDALEQQPGADLAYISQAGLSRWSDRLPDIGEVPPLRLIRVASTGLSGQLQVRIGDAKSPVVLHYAAEYSLDQGTTWHSAAFSSSRNFLLRDLPASRDLRIRVRALATRSRHSAWSAPVMAVVA